MSYKAGFIGTGNMGSALALAASKTEKNIVLADAFEEKAKELALKIGCDATSNEKAAEASKFLFLGVKPQVLPSLLQSIKETLKSRKDRFVLVSMAAGVPIKTITDTLGFECPVIRIMPNLPVALGEGVVLISNNSAVNSDELDEFEVILSKAGKTVRMEEKLIDAGCAVSGCGPAYVYMFIEALTDGGVACGLPYKESLELAAQTLIGASKMVLESGEAPGKLRSNVCSPAGTTIEGVKVLEEKKFRAAAMDAVIAGYKKSKELAR